MAIVQNEIGGNFIVSRDGIALGEFPTAAEAGYFWEEWKRENGDRGAVQEDAMEVNLEPAHDAENPFSFPEVIRVEDQGEEEALSSGGDL